MLELIIITSAISFCLMAWVMISKLGGIVRQLRRLNDRLDEDSITNAKLRALTAKLKRSQQNLTTATDTIEEENE